MVYLDLPCNVLKEIALKEVYPKMYMDNWTDTKIYRSLIIAYLYEYVSKEFPNSLLLHKVQYILWQQYIDYIANHQYESMIDLFKMTNEEIFNLAERIESAYIIINND